MMSRSTCGDATKENYVNGFELPLQLHILEAPLVWKRPRLIFVNSMSELFHKNIPSVELFAKVLKDHDSVSATLLADCRGR